MPINQSGLNEPSPSGRNKAPQVLAILKPLRGRGSFKQVWKSSQILVSALFANIHPFEKFWRRLDKMPLS